MDKGPRSDMDKGPRSDMDKGPRSDMDKGPRSDMDKGPRSDKANSPAPTATVAETVGRAFKPIQQFTRGWMMAEETAAYGVELGMRSGRHFQLVGRAGVMGSCNAMAAYGALAFMAEDHVFGAWNNVPAGLTHYQVAEHMLSRVLAWGEAELTRFDVGDMRRLDELGRRIAGSAHCSLGPIFAGWRSYPQPDNAGAAVAQTTQVLREMRGAAHLVAITAKGLSPLDAILASTNAPPRTGPEYAAKMGFTGPFRDPEEVRAKRLEAEDLTAEIMMAHFAALSGEELAEFGELVETTRNAIDM